MDINNIFHICLLIMSLRQPLAPVGVILASCTSSQAQLCSLPVTWTPDLARLNSCVLVSAQKRIAVS
jgi:hypothetical protein